MIADLDVNDGISVEIKKAPVITTLRPSRQQAEMVKKASKRVPAAEAGLSNACATFALGQRLKIRLLNRQNVSSIQRITFHRSV